MSIMKQMRVYRCEDTPEGIFTAVYDAGKSAYGHDHIRLEVIMPGGRTELYPVQ